MRIMYAELLFYFHLICNFYFLHDCKKRKINGNFAPMLRSNNKVDKTSYIVPFFDTLYKPFLTSLADVENYVTNTSTKQ